MLILKALFNFLSWLSSSTKVSLETVVCSARTLQVALVRYFSLKTTSHPSLLLTQMTSVHPLSLDTAPSYSPTITTTTIVPRLTLWSRILWMRTSLLHVLTTAGRCWVGSETHSLVSCHYLSFGAFKGMCVTWQNVVLLIPPKYGMSGSKPLQCIEWRKCFLT